MAGERTNLIGAIGALALAFVVFGFAGRAMLFAYSYPKPRGLPPVVDGTTERLLVRLQAVVESNAPVVARSLQPGLSDTQISALESQGGFHLSDELRALYRWHNGMPTNNTVGLMPGLRFLPLDEIVSERTQGEQNLSSASAVQRAALSFFAGHRNGWEQVLDDGAGDGYFFDPDRTASEGAFFYHFAEVRYYLWFPSLNNFLAGLIECFETQAIRSTRDPKVLEEDAGRTQKVWERFGAASESNE